jgi:uncharacterized protein YaaN involved in tellurite resistance
MAEDKSSEPVTVERQALAGMDLKEVTRSPPQVPKDMTTKEADELKAWAQAVARQLEDASGSRELEIADSLAGLGVQIQRQAASELGLLKARAKDLLSGEGLTGRVSDDLVELRLALKQIAPAEVGRAGLWDRLLDMLPFRHRVLRILERIAMRYEPVSRQVVLIESRLREGRMMLTRDNVELRKLYERVEAQQPAIARYAFLGELLMQRLTELMERLTEPQRKEKVQNVLYDVAMRVQDLRAMAEVHAQFFVSLEMTRHNNTRLGQAVDRTLTLATNVVMVGLAIQVALARQKRVLEATQRTREFLGDMIVTNAETIRRHTEEIGDVYKEPVIAVEKITEAHNALLDAIETASRLKQEGITSARDNISRLNGLAGALEERFAGRRESSQRKSDLPPIPASLG